MNTLKISTIIKVNSSTVLRNALFNYFVSGIDCKTSLNNYLERIKEYQSAIGIENDINPEACKNLFLSYIERSKKDCRFIYLEDKKRAVSPQIRNFKDFAAENEMPFENIRQMQIFINNNF